MPRATRKAGLSAAAFLFVIVILGVAWSRTIEMRIPDGFHGFIRVTVDPAAKPPSIGLLRLVVHVPASGATSLPTLDIFRRFHHQSAITSSGVRLPLVLPGDRYEGRAFHIMNTPPTPQVFFYVGTREELLAFLATSERRLYAVDAR
jgi:hypothetical protein